MFSLSKIIQSKAITLDNNCKSIQGKMGCRLITVILKPPGLLLDITTNIFAGIAKIVVRFFIIAPINFSVKLIGKKGVQSEWTIKQGCYHLGVAGLYTLDLFIQPFCNTILGPNIYFKTVTSKFWDAFVDSSCKDDMGQTSLFHTVISGNAKVVQKHVKSGANVNSRNHSAFTPLILAINGNNLEIVKILIDAGADVNMGGHFGTTPLITASNNFEIVKTLIDAGADVNAKNLFGTTPLLATYKNENAQVLEKLIDSGADVNETVYDEVSLLWDAIMQSKTKMVKILLDKNARSHTRDGDNAAYIFKYVYRNRNVLFDQSVIEALRMTSHEKQVKLLKLIGHVAEIPGANNFNGTEIKFSGLFPGRLIPKQLQKNLRAFGANQLLTNNVLKTLTDTLELNTGICRPSTEDLIARHSDNMPIIIETGYTGHSLKVVLWENYFFLCNRVKLPPGLPRFQTFKIDESQDIRQLILIIRSWESISADEFFQSYINLWESKTIVHVNVSSEVEQVLGIKAHSLFEVFSLPQQTMGNCVYSSYEDALYVIWQIAQVREIQGNSPIQECLNGVNLSNIVQIVQSLRNVKTEFDSFRAFQMKSYLDRLDAINPLLLSESQRQHVDEAIAEAEGFG